MNDWNTGLADEGLVLMTKIDDAAGCRNEQPLKRRGNLWWFPDDSMYVYYRPTHWRKLTIAEEADHLARMGEKASALRREADRLEGVR